MENHGRTQWRGGSTPPLRVLLIVRVRLYREGLERALAGADDVVVVGSAADLSEGIALVRATRPEAAILDVVEPGTRRAIRRLAAAVPTVPIVALAVDDNATEALALVEAGAGGYVSRDASLSDLIGTVVSTARGEMRCNPRMAAALARRLQVLAADAEPPPPTASLTAREREILALIDDGLANKEIARRLHIELPTVKNHVHHILEKLGVRRRADAAACVRARAGDGLAVRRASSR